LSINVCNEIRTRDYWQPFDHVVSAVFRMLQHEFDDLKDNHDLKMAASHNKLTSVELELAGKLSVIAELHS